MQYVASLSGGKDSLAMVLRIIDEGMPLDKVINFDEGMNFEAVSHAVDKAESIIRSYGAELVRLRPKENFLLSMFAKPIKTRSGDIRFGYGWCGANARWMTSIKTSAIRSYISSIGDHRQYIGIAFDELSRAKESESVIYPLIDWRMTESDCLAYCRSKGFNWIDRGGVDLYDVLDRASCWCCRNKNLNELRQMRKCLPFYWERLMGLQSRISQPYRRDGATVFDLDSRFEQEDKQMKLF